MSLATLTTKVSPMKVGLVKVNQYALMQEIKEYNICYPDGSIAGYVQITDYTLNLSVKLLDGTRFNGVFTYNTNQAFDYRRLITTLLKELCLEPQFNDPIEQAMIEQEDDGRDLYSD